MQALISKLPSQSKNKAIRRIRKHTKVECSPFGEVCSCNRLHFLELSTLVNNCQVYLPFLTLDKLSTLSKAPDYQAALEQLFPTSTSFETTDRPYAYFDDQMKLLQDLQRQLSSSAIMKKRFIVTTRHHHIISSDNIALVVIRNLNLLADVVQNTRSIFEVSWWNFLDQNSQKAEAMLIGIMNERRNSPEKYWDNIPNVSFRDFSTLGAGRWLNDEIINYFIEKWCSQSTSTLGLNTYFAGRCLFEVNTSCTKAKIHLTNQDEQRVINWVKARQRKLGLEYWDAVFIPIHESSSHWYSAYIDFRLKRIEIFDSLEATFVTNNQKPVTERKNTHLTLVLMWLTEILGRLRGESILLTHNPQTEWVFVPHAKVHFQPNTYDCGVHTLWHLKHILEHGKVMLGRKCKTPGLSFTNNMAGKRVRLALELLQDCEL